MNDAVYDHSSGESTHVSKEPHDSLYSIMLYIHIDFLLLSLLLTYEAVSEELNSHII